MEDSVPHPILALRVLYSYAIQPLLEHMANDIFRSLLDICLIIHLDDLLVYSKTQEEDDSHVLLVLS